MDGWAQWPATRVNIPACISGKKERRHTQQRESAEEWVRSLLLSLNSTGAQGREKRQVGRGEGRLGLEGVWVWTRGLEELRGNTRYLEREDWCRTSDTGEKHCTSCPFKIFGGRLWVEMRGVWGFRAVQLQG